MPGGVSFQHNTFEVRVGGFWQQLRRVRYDRTRRKPIMQGYSEKASSRALASGSTQSIVITKSL